MTSVGETNSKLICEKHAHQLLEDACLDPKCNKDRLCCGQCLTEEHNQCDALLVVPLNALRSDKVKVIENCGESNQSESAVESLEKLILRMKVILHNIKRSMSQAVSSLPVLDLSRILDSEMLELAKREYTMQYSAQDQTVVFIAKPCRPETELQKLSNKLKEEVESGICKFMTEMQKLNEVTTNCTLNVEDWEHHENITVEKSDSGVLVGHKPNSYGFECAFYSLPLQTTCEYKFTPQSINEGYRSFVVGIIGTANYEKAKKKHSMAFINGGISFWGFGASDGFSGEFLAKELKAPKVFRHSAYYIMEYVPGKSIRFYNEEGTLDISRSMEGDSDTYYMFVVPQYVENSLLIKRIS